MAHHHNREPGTLRRRVLLGRLGLAAFGACLPGSRSLAVSHPGGAGSRMGGIDALEVPIRLVTVASAENRFMGWPANNGGWSWEQGKEILVGYEEGPWEDKGGHKIGSPQHKRLARSLDGGRSWRQETPEPFVGREGRPRYASGGIRFGHPDFALRVAVGGAADRRDRVGRFFVSYDRGRRWSGPFRFAGLGDDQRLQHLEMTSRTDVLLTGTAALVMMSARDPRQGPLADRLDKPFVARSLDGGRSFRFLAWIVPWSDPHRAVLPSSLRMSCSGTLLTALRRMDPRRPETSNWVDLYASLDHGMSWSFRSRVGETGSRNGNPPSLLQLSDGRLACAYGNRSSQRMIVRFSPDEGHSWGPELTIREIPFHYDFGYPQLIQNQHGDLVLIYYLSTRQRPHSYIEAALFSAGPLYRRETERPPAMPEA